MPRADLLATLESTALQYPTPFVAEQLADVPRMAFGVELVQRALAGAPLAEIEICDIGGGLGLFSTGCAALGMRRVTLVDDFGDEANARAGESVFALHRRLGVEIFSRDAVAQCIDDLPGQYDAITTFGSMEHWHHSPRRLFASVMRKLRPGGAFVLEVPNCVNLRKRVSVPFGHGKWSQMKDWYEPPVFRGHVREADVDDLHYIAQDMGLTDTHILGRNWVGHLSPSRLVRVVTRLLDRPLQALPRLCGNIYLVGHKPGSGRQNAAR